MVLCRGRNTERPGTTVSIIERLLSACPEQIAHLAAEVQRWAKDQDQLSSLLAVTRHLWLSAAPRNRHQPPTTATSETTRVQQRNLATQLAKVSRSSWRPMPEGPEAVVDGVYSNG